jgi:hypothetical protein
MDRKRELDLLRAIDFITRAFIDVCETHARTCLGVANDAAFSSNVARASDYAARHESYTQSAKHANEWLVDTQAKIDRIEREVAGARAN